MIIKQLIHIVTFIYWFMAYSYICMTPSLLLGYESIVKPLSQTLTTKMLLDAFNIEFFIGKTELNIKKLMQQNPELIDIMVCNHISTIDFLLILSYLQHFDITGYNFVVKKSLIYIPGLGFVIYANQNIKLNRNWEKDKNNIGNQLDKIKTNSFQKQILIIFPEGTRLNETKLLEAQLFSLDNNLPVFNNLLVPKTKGLWYLVNHLKLNNKLGRIWDLTLVMPNFLGSSAYTSDIIGKSIGPVYGIFKELDLTEINSDYQDLSIFKSWFLKNWKIKDILLDNYKQIVYNKIEFNNKYRHLTVIALIILISMISLSKKNGRYYILVSFILSYAIIFFRK